MKVTETPPAVPAPRSPVTKTAAPAVEPAKSSEGKVLNVFSHGVLVIWAVLVVMPLLWAVMSSFKTDDSILSTPWSLPDKLHFENWSRAWNQAHMSDYFLNTILVVGGSLIGTLLLGSMAAYVLARFDFPGNRFIYFLFIGGMSFPIILALVPLFFVMNNMGLLNSVHGLILVYIAYSLPFTVFFLTSFFRTLPTSIAEAAMLDGATHTRTFFQVMLPMAKPGLISVGIFNFLGQWNQYMLPTVLNTDPDGKVLSQGLVELATSQGYKGDWSGLFAGLVMAMLPVLAAYIVFQRQVVAGLTAGALK
ncbi:carbohydrate ABC transporter permease [Streptomyces sp. NE06-03E]|uniref:Carbohydrate ABC transporter permease n=2 Tax=Streptomyces TaxID=1883 RepID=A0A652KYJ5_9ACTN|nr:MULTISPECIES: carbohydrate ABC transporter permease [Streptomyces]WSS64929.1 carbohydrate ABC transporter permease [Streptomyces sp. NBC_01177]WSS71918.1 carbohydrate ABC transporter permease [Streptomyces sp. NBC_01175]WSS78925.1 carbohydrate ABC transporter permease [Streptomyces sp. NBC_01174]MBL1291572.1 carbohydrate ABC transporter permease [Streptomyces silvae]MDX3056598.1 carbohydrate ABC transporter permease [Streptomyces sp. NE06-03E]